MTVSLFGWLGIASVLAQKTVFKVANKASYLLKLLTVYFIKERQNSGLKNCWAQYATLLHYKEQTINLLSVG